MSGRALLYVLCFASAFAGIAYAADLSSFPPPRTIQSRDGAGPVIYWDATAYVERFVSLGTPAPEALAALKYEAVRLFVRQAPGLARNERYLRVVVSFAKTGAISKRYQTKTFEGVENLLAVEGALHRGMRFDKGWGPAARRGKFPKGIRVRLLSELPSEQQP
ncbi:MAG: hypothetical protein DLM50_01940 [Candidatus Meridianibacter frigidus]|nr:MAG: hypothetical protein DLM50_01940 [Candidatus Eremiobacteraeota bacterium]